MILDLVVIGIAVALDPLPLTAFMVVLASRHGARNGAAYVFGWLVSLGLVVTATILATGNNPPKDKTTPSLASLAVKMALGVFLVWYGLRRERRRGLPKPPKKTPKWQQRVDSMSPWLAMGLGTTLQPWVLIAAGVATIVSAKLSSAGSVLVLFGYCVLASSTYLVMEVYAVFRPARCQELLARLRAWIDDHTDQVLIIGSLLAGFWLIGKSLYVIVA